MNVRNIRDSGPCSSDVDDNRTDKGTFSFGKPCVVERVLDPTMTNEWGREVRELATLGWAAARIELSTVILRRVSLSPDSLCWAIQGQLSLNVGSLNVVILSRLSLSRLKWHCCRLKHRSDV